MLVEVCQTIETHDITQKPVNNDQNPFIPQIQKNPKTHQNQNARHTVTQKDQKTQDLDTFETTLQAEFYQSGGQPPRQADLGQKERKTILNSYQKNTKWGIGVFNFN